MEQIKDFDEFYKTRLSPYLHELKKRKRLSSFWMIICVILGLLFIPFLALFLAKESETGTKTTFAVVVVLLIIGIWQWTKNSDNFEDGFKTHIIGQIIAFIHPGLTYKSNTCVNEIDYKSSGLFRQNIRNYDGDDLVSGTYKNVNFKCSEISVSSNQRRDYSDTIFHGLFFAAPLNISFSGGTYIWRNNNLQLPTSIADEAFRLMPMPAITKVDCKDGHFEKCYSVFTTDVYEASSIVTGKMMERIMHFKEQINRDVTLSFVAGICYVAIPFDDPLFETFGNDTASKEDVKEYFFTVLLILSIINQLKLYEL